MNAPFNTSPGEIIEREPDPIAIDPRPCGLCGLTIDRHEMVDDGEGPEFFCTGEIDDAATSGVWQPEIADPRRRWPEARRRPEPYRPAESTVQAFWYVARTHDDPDYLAAWLPSIRPTLRTF